MGGAQVVLFDMDGTLVDSEGAELQALIEFAQLCGVSLTGPEAAAAFKGRRLAESLHTISQLCGQAEAADGAEWIRARCEALLSDLKPIDGAVETLGALELPRYVVSNSPLDIIENRLRRAGLSKFLPGPHFSAYEVGSWKPNPHLYRHAVAQARFVDSQALVVEDSVVGAAAAVSAGIRTLWYSPHDNDHSVPDGTTRIRDLRELLNHL